MIKNFAKITNGVITQVACAESVWPFVDDPHIELPDGFGIGDLYDGRSFSKSPAAALPIGIPASVTMRQARRALANSGLLLSTNNAIATMPGAAGEAARIDWEYSQVVRRDWPLVAALMPTLGLTSAQVDQLFITAATL